MSNKFFLTALSLLLISTLRCQITIFPEANLEYDSVFQDDLKNDETFKYVLFAATASTSAYIDEYSGIYYQPSLDCTGWRGSVLQSDLHNIAKTNLKGLYRTGCVNTNVFNYIHSGYTTQNATAEFEITFRLSNPSDQELKMKLVTCSWVNMTTNVCFGEVEVDSAIVIPLNSIFKYNLRWNKNRIWTSTDNFLISKSISLPETFTLYFYTTNLDPANDPPNIKRLYIHSMITTVDLGTEIRALNSNSFNFCVNDGCVGGTYCYKDQNPFRHVCSIERGTGGEYPYQDCGSRGCIPGTYCSTNCLPCDEQCATCSNGNPMNCRSCYRTAVAPSWYNTVQYNTGTGQACTFEYISLTNFGAINFNVPIPTTYRMTIEFWVFVHDTQKLKDSALRPSVSSIKLKNLFSLCLMSSGTAKEDIDLMLLPYEYFYPFPEDIISVTQLNSFLTTNADIQKVSSTITNASSRWVYLKAGLSYQHREMFSNSRTSPLNPIRFISGGRHYSSFLRNFYREGDKTSISFQGFSYVNSLIYIRNVNVYSEYIPLSVSSQYFNIHLIRDYETIPQLLFSVPFDKTNIITTELTGNTKYFDFSGQFNSGKTNQVEGNDVSFSWVGGILKPPKNFRRLKLLPNNNVYSTTDLGQPSTFLCTQTNSLCYDVNKPFVCANSNSLELNTITCGPNCHNSMRLPNNKINLTNDVKLNRHFCGYQCDSNVQTCPENNNDSLLIFNCKPGFTPIFFHCNNDVILPPSKSALQFSGTLNTHSMEFTLPSSYSNFLIEMWFHPELLYQTDPPLIKKHIIKTNAHELFYSPTEDSLMFKANIGGLDSDFIVKQKLYYYGWNHVILLNKPVLSNTYTEFSLSILNTFQVIGSAVGIASMNKICLCNKDFCCGSIGINWLDMWIREIKVWDGALVHFATLINFEKFNYVRPAGLLHFLPFQISNLNVNKIVDSINPAVIAIFPNQPFKLNPDQDMNYNYGWDFSWNDQNYPKFITKTKIESKNKVTITNFLECNLGCEICFGESKNSCFKCQPGYALSGATCTLTSDSIGYYYFMNPLSSGVSLSLALPNLSLFQSITFFCYLKVYGFTNAALATSNTDMIIFNSRDSFKLRYNPLTFEMSLTLNGIPQFIDLNFIEKFGIWLPISIAFFRSNDLTLQLHMNSMTVNSKPLKLLVDPPQLFPFTEITFSSGMIGLISQVTLFNQFIINGLGYAQHYNSPGSIFSHPAIIIKHFPMRSTNNNSCIPSTDMTQPVTGLKCVEDYIAQIDQKCSDTQFVSLIGQSVPPRCVDNASKCDNIIQTIIQMTNCEELYGACDNISMNSINNMPFSFTNTARENYIVCGQSNTLDMARYNPGRIPNIKSPNDVFKLEFWFLSQSYVGINFGSFTASWHRHIKITVSFAAGGKFHAHCYPLIDNANSANDGVGIGFDYSEATVLENRWRYAVCGIDIANREYYITNLQKDNYVKAHLGLNGNVIPGGTVNLIISESSKLNFGVTYIRELRLWNCYQCSSDRAFIPFNQEDPLFDKMIHYFKFEDTKGLIKDYGTDPINGDTAISIQLIQKNNFNGYGLLKKIPDAPNCNESGFNYFSLKNGVGCDTLFNMNMLPDITFPKLPSSKNGRYTIDMWVYIESPDDFTKGFNIIFNEHMAISSFAKSKTDTDITIYCFPQAYRDNLYNKSGGDIINSFTKAQNKLKDTFINSYSKWNYVRCGYNYDTKEAYLNNQPPISLLSEMFYSNPASHSNAAPFKFFPNFYNNLIINKVIDNFTRIFIQTINIFREYIPQSINLSRISMKNYANANYFPLIFSVDFQNDYDIIQNRLKYYYTDPDYNPSSPAYLTSFLTNSKPKTYLTYPLYDDFVLCGIGRTYNSLLNACEIITSPGTCDNKNTFCFDNNKYFYCEKGLYLDIDTYTCNADCTSLYTRAPDILDESGMCQFKRSIFTQSPYLNSEMKRKKYKDLFLCDPNNEVKVYYQCLSQSLVASSAIYFSKKYSFINTIADYSSLKLKDYFVDFWFMFERIEQFRFDDKTERRTIFIAYPHFITRIGNQIEYNNQFIPLKYYPINNIKKYEWNRVVIENYEITGEILIDTRKYVNVFINNDFLNPEVEIESTKANDFSLAQIAFCSFINDGFSICNLGLDSSSYKVFAPIWEDAFYRNIIVWNRQGTNLSNINSFHSLYNEITSNIISYHSMRLDTIQPKNIQSAVNSPLVDLVARYNTMNEYDAGASINYITDFDIGIPSGTIDSIASGYVDKTIPMFSLGDTTFTIVQCSHPCLRCFSSNANECFSCVTGFVLSGTKCSGKTNHYFKTPTSNSATQATIDLNLDVSNYNEITFTFYMKFLGSLQKNVSVIPILFFYNYDNFIGWNNDDNSFCLVYNVNQKAFDYNKSRLGIGKWTLFGLSISKSRSNAGESSITFPNMINLMIDRVIVPPHKDFASIIMSSLINYNKLSLSNTVSALYFDLRVFNKYYLGSFGIGQDPTSSSLSSFITGVSFKSIANDNSCINTSDSIGSGYCISDLNQFDDPAYDCPNPSTQFRIVNPFDLTFTCTTCDSYCTSHCYDKGINGCTCSIDSGTYWIRNDTSYYCNRLDSLNIAEFSPIIISNIGIGSDNSYMIEVWIFIVDYLSDQYKGINISWDKFNRIEILPKSNSELYARCYPYVELTDMGKWPENAEVIIQKGKWEFLRCKVDTYTKIIVMNDKTKTLTTLTRPTPGSSSQLKIEDMNLSSYSYGVILMRELRLWNEHNNLFYDTARLNLAIDNTYKNLIHYYKNIFPATESQRNYMYDEKKKQKTQLTIKRAFNYYSYISFYEELVLCNEGQVFKLNSITNKYECSLYQNDDILDNIENDQTLYTPNDLLTKAKMLHEMALNKYIVPPSSLIYSQIGIDTEGIMTLKDPSTANSYCNNKGYAKIIDRTLCCYCFIDNVGAYCQLASKNYNTIDKVFSHFTNKAFETFEKYKNGSDLDKIISSFDNLITGSGYYVITNEFITGFISKISSIIYEVTQCREDLLKLIDHLYSNIIQLINYYKVGIITNQSSGSSRNAKLNYLQKDEIRPSATAIKTFIEFLAEKCFVKLTSETIHYNFKTDNFNIDLIRVTSSFNYEDFFGQKQQKKYEPYFDLSPCLNNDAQVMSINWYNNPYSYEENIHWNYTSSYMTIKTFDLNGNQMMVQKCPEPIKFYLNNFNPDLVSIINENKKFFKKSNIYPPTDRIFTEPFYIESNGKVNTSSLQERINSFYFSYRLVFNSLNALNFTLTQESLAYEDLREENNYFLCTSTHLSEFVLTYDYNEPPNQIDGRLYFLKHLNLFIYAPNYEMNVGFFSVVVIVGIYLINLIVCLIKLSCKKRKKGIEQLFEETLISYVFPYGNFEGEFFFKDDGKKVFKSDEDLNNDKKGEDNLKVLSGEKETLATHKSISPFDNVTDVKDEANNILKINKRVMNKNEFENFFVKMANNEKEIVESSDNKPSEVIYNNNPINQKRKNKINNNYIETAAIAPLNNSDSQKTNLNYKHNLKIYNEDLRTRLLQQMNLSSAKFFLINFTNRNLIISSFKENIIYTPAIKSLYLPMYLTLILLINTLIYLFESSMSYELLFSEQLGYFIGFSLIAVISSNIYFYIKSFLYNISKSSMRDLLLKSRANAAHFQSTYAKLTKKFTIFFIIEIIVFIAFVLLCFVFSFGLSAVYNDQAKCMMLSSLCGIAADFVLSMIVELLVAFVYTCRKNNVMVIILDHLNRLKSHKVISP